MEVRGGGATKDKLALNGAWAGSHDPLFLFYIWIGDKTVEAEATATAYLGGEEHESVGRRRL